MFVWTLSWITKMTDRRRGIPRRGAIPNFQTSRYTSWRTKVQRGEAGTEPGVLISARTEDGRRVIFRHDEIRDWYGNIRLDHGYALTITSAGVDRGPDIPASRCKART